MCHERCGATPMHDPSEGWGHGPLHLHGRWNGWRLLNPLPKSLEIRTINRNKLPAPRTAAEPSYSSQLLPPIPSVCLSNLGI